MSSEDWRYWILGPNFIGPPCPWGKEWDGLSYRLPLYCRAYCPYVSKIELEELAKSYPAGVLQNPLLPLFLLEDPGWRVPREAQYRLAILTLQQRGLRDPRRNAPENDEEDNDNGYGGGPQDNGLGDGRGVGSTWCHYEDGSGDGASKCGYVDGGGRGHGKDNQNDGGGFGGGERDLGNGDSNTTGAFYEAP